MPKHPDAAHQVTSLSRRIRFRGQIAGIGSVSGVRIVLGRWVDSPWGAFGDAMVERSDGHRVLLAPDATVAQFVAATYEFDEIRMQPFAVTRSGDGPGATWQVRSDSLHLDLTVGRPSALGRLLALVPVAVARATWWCVVTDLVARVFLRGVRTRGETATRREWYGATGNRRITHMSGTFDGADLGALARVTPPPRFGFSATPPRSSVTDIVTTVELGFSDPEHLLGS